MAGTFDPQILNVIIPGNVYNVQYSLDYNRMGGITNITDNNSSINSIARINNGSVKTDAYGPSNVISGAHEIYFASGIFTDGSGNTSNTLNQIFYLDSNRAYHTASVSTGSYSFASNQFTVAVNASVADIAYATGNLVVTNGAGFQTTATAVAESVAGGIDTITYQLANAPTADGTYSVYVSGYNVAANGLASTAKITVTGSFPPAAPTGSFPSTGNSVTFDGTKSVTAAKGDLLVLTLDPQTFAGGAEQNGNVVLSATNGTSATITNAFLTSDGIPNTFVPQGDFLVGREGFSITSTKANSILIGLPGSEQIRDIVDPSLAAGSHFISGGVGRVDSTDGADTISIGGKGLWSVFANAGADIVTQDGAATSGFDSASVVNVYGQEGNDSITLTNAANIKASIFVSGGAGADTIAVVNSGATTIFGGDDSTDATDRITFNGVNGAGGTAVIFGNGGDDTITVGNTANLDSTSTATVYGGFGNDQITVAGTKATLSIVGGEGSDTITVQNTGTTFITGGNLSGGDQSLDGADRITVDNSGGTIAIFSNLGNDTVSATGLQDSTSIQIYGGKGSDTITETNATITGKNTIFIAGGEDGDTIAATGNGGALTIYGGISSADSADGADAITIGNGSQGTTNVFANGGNDTVNIGTLGTDSTTTATIYGGGGNDTITVQAQGAFSQALVLNGNEGADTFSIVKGIGQTITVADFKASEGDKLTLTALGGTPGTLQVTGGSYQTLQDALNAAANTANGATNVAKAAAVAFAGSTYVVIDNTTGAGFQATDQAIKLTGVTDLIGLVGSTTLVG